MRKRVQNRVTVNQRRENKGMASTEKNKEKNECERMNCVYA